MAGCREAQREGHWDGRDAAVAAWLPENERAARMVRTQLENRDIHDPRVRAAMARLPRHRFIPDGPEGDSYADHPMPIGHGQTISQPYMVAVMTQELRLVGTERVLEIGTGSGYQTAVLAALCAEVYSVERIGALLERARLLLADLGFVNIRCRQGDGCQGWVEYAPYDRIMVTAAAPEIPEHVRLQLAEDGVLVAPVGDADGYQRLVTVRRIGGRYETAVGLGCRFVPLIEGDA